MSAPKINFTGVDIDTPLGQVVVFKGQRYELTGHRPHVRQDGSKTELLVWATHCARCSGPTEIMMPLGGVSPSRRCQRCKRPGSAA